MHPFVMQSWTQHASPTAVTSGIAAVQYHPDDKFLAVASTTVGLFSVPGMEPLGDLRHDEDASPLACMSVAAGQPLIATGSLSGAVTVWDWKRQEVVHTAFNQHAGGTTAVQFVPLDPTLLYSTGADGTVVLHDLRTGRMQSTVQATGLDPVRCMSIKEDGSAIAVGTSTGTVLVYDPRHMEAPPRTLHCTPTASEPAPVTSLHWQHNYQSLSTRVRTAAALNEPSKAANVQTAAAEDLTPTQPRGRLSMAASLTTTLEPPARLDATPIAGINPTRSAASAASSPATSLAASFISGARVGMNSTTSAVLAMEPHPAGTSLPGASPGTSAAVSLDRHRTSSAMHAPAGPSGGAMPAVRPLSRGTGHCTDDGCEAGARAAPWSIKAVTPRGGNGPSRSAPAHEDFEPNSATGAGVGSPSKRLLGQMAPTKASTAALDGCPPPEGQEGLREDILALHLDMLNQFQEQQAATAALIAGMAQRQDALMDEVKELRQQLQDLLTRRDGTLWL